VTGSNSSDLANFKASLIPISTTKSNMIPACLGANASGSVDLNMVGNNLLVHSKYVYRWCMHYCILLVVTYLNELQIRPPLSVDCDWW